MINKKMNVQEEFKISKINTHKVKNSDNYLR